jgi:CheY-like chemotaxis protein
VGVAVTLRLLQGIAVTDQCRFLIVDDDHDAADSLGLVLGSYDFDAQVVYDGVSALSAALSSPPDVMLVDLGMRGMDGIRLAEFVRREESLQKTLLVAVTGYASAAVEEAARAAGFDHYLLKPVPIGRILGLIRSTASLLKQRTENTATSWVR